MGVRWTDLVAPTAHELAEALPSVVDPSVIDALTAPAAAAPRAGLEPHGGYVAGQLAIPDVDGDDVVFAELGIVVTPSLIVTVHHGAAFTRRTWEARAHSLADRADDTGHALHLLVDELAADLVVATDRIFERVDAAEDLAAGGKDADIPAVLSGIRHDVIHTRRHVSGLRNAIRRIVDGRTDVPGEALFPADLERLFATTADGLQRTAEELDIARELVAGLRDHHQANVMEAQNEVVKKLTVIASLVLVPSLVTGFFGQNFESAFSHAWWHLWVAIGLIVASTAAQLALFRWRRWI